MSRHPDSEGEPIEKKSQLIEDLESGCKSKENWRIGTEHEKFPFRLSDNKRLPYEGPDGIAEILNRLTRFGWQPIREKDNVIALSLEGCAITLEPGGQFELSGAPLETIHQTCDEVHTHLAQVKEVGDELGIGMLGLGFDPKWARNEVPWMPKGRYSIMKRWMQEVGTLGLDMMLRTCTVQTNLDFSHEADMVQKYRISIALQPLATALFANSPFQEGGVSNCLSLRSNVWTDTDPYRCGMLPFVFEEGYGFERHVDYILDVPMYFVYRDGIYHDVAGKSFRDFMAGKLEGFEGELPHMGDWADHMTTNFPEVRLKKYIEMRGTDGGPWKSLCALPAFWVGLLYDSDAQQAAWNFVKDWTDVEREDMRRRVPVEGLSTKFRNTTLQQLAKQVLRISSRGLKNRGNLDAAGNDESGFLDTLRDIADRGKTPAEDLVEAFKTRWSGSVDPVYSELRY